MSAQVLTETLSTVKSIFPNNVTNESQRAVGWRSLKLTYPVWAAVLIVLSVFFVWMLCCLGNALVIVAIAVDRRLQGVQHWFLASLAAADFLLGVLVLPFSLVKQLLGGWVFGERWCELWLVIDVLLCTASILNICLISLDRYWCVSQPLTYPQSRSSKRAGGMIALVWLLAAVVCVPPLLGWRQPQPDANACQLTDDLGYVLYSTLGSFYIPATIMSIVYMKIFMVTREHTRRSNERHRDKDIISNMSHHQNAKLKDAAALELKPCLNDDAKADENDDCEYETSSYQKLNKNGVDSDAHFNQGDKATLLCCGRRGAADSTTASTIEKHLRQKRKLVKNRERRATIILGLIMGAFILCWFPFFTTYVIEILCRRARCPSAHENSNCSCIPALLFDFFFWLGYCNSALNPAIYTVFNRDFRLAFHQLLTCRQHRRI